MKLALQTWLWHKGRISKWVFQENKACQIFQKTNLFLPPDAHTSLVIRQKSESQNMCFKKTKQVDFFEKRNIFYPLTRTCTCAYQGVKNIRFSKNLTCFVFLKRTFWDSPFCHITHETEFHQSTYKYPALATKKNWNS